MGLKAINPLIKAVAKKAYVAPKMEVRTLESLGLKMEQLTGDVVQLSKKAKSPETYINMVEHFMTKHPQNKEIVKNIAIKGVEAHPTNNGLIAMKNYLIDDSEIFIADLSRSISLKPTAQSYMMRYMILIEQGKTKEALGDLKKALEYAKKENQPELISEIESMLGSKSSNIAKKLKPLPLTKEQEILNTKVAEYWNKYQKQINDVFEEKMYFRLSNSNCTYVEVSAKNHLLNSIKKIGKAEDFGLTKDLHLYHGTDSEACSSIRTYGFDLSKCGRVETGRGAYFGFDEQAVRKAYGSNVIEARFIGKNIAKVEPGVYDVISGGEVMTPFKHSMANRLGLDTCKDNKILEEIISKYYNTLLESKGIEGIITDVSFNAGMPYFMVPNPSKYIEIL